MEGAEELTIYAHLHRWMQMHLNPDREICLGCKKARNRKTKRFTGDYAIEKKAGRSKYGNRPATAFQISFKSQAERDHALWLESEKQAGHIAGWQYEKSFDLWAGCPNGTARMKLVGRHRPDFFILHHDGRFEVHEIKADVTKTEAWGLRRKLFEINYPHIPYRVFDGSVTTKWTR